MTIYLFGNPILKQDSLPIKLLPKLKKAFPHINFIIKDPAENWTEDKKEVVIIDAVIGLKDVTVFNSLDDFEKNNPRISPHDYDVYLDLALMKKVGKINKISIIGIPSKNNPNLFNQLTSAVRSLL